MTGDSLADRLTAPAVTGIACVVVDCDDPGPLALWWQGLLGGELTLHDDGDASLRSPGRPHLDFLKVTDTRVVKNRIHLDLETSDLQLALEQVVAHGATRALDVFPGDAFHVLRDPEGNEFCLLRPDWDSHP